MVTNESGVTYHFALPAYASEDYFYSKNTEAGAGHSLRSNGKYAYAWYLTAITGSDFVDRNGNGLADQDDWGYWVRFRYGLWANDFVWRNPGKGFHKDIDNRFISYTSGKKQLFYLDAIETRSHTALFVKEIRADGKSVTNAKDDGYKPSRKTQLVEEVPSGYESYYKYPVSTLRLKTILLVENDELNQLSEELGFNRFDDTRNSYQGLNDFRENSDRYEDPVITRFFDYTEHEQQLHYGHHILDVHDLKKELGSAINQRLLRK